MNITKFYGTITGENLRKFTDKELKKQIEDRKILTIEQFYEKWYDKKYNERRNQEG